MSSAINYQMVTQGQNEERERYIKCKARVEDSANITRQTIHFHFTNLAKGTFVPVEEEDGVYIVKTKMW